MVDRDKSFEIEALHQRVHFQAKEIYIQELSFGAEMYYIKKLSCGCYVVLGYAGFDIWFRNREVASEYFAKSLYKADEGWRVFDKKESKLWERHKKRDPVP